jgi:hypothetical protein
MGVNKKIYFPKIRLTELVMKPGGMTRDDAVAAAVRNVQSISGEGDLVMIASIQALEKIVTGCGGKLDAAALVAVLAHADQIITLSGTFGYDALDRATRSLCDTVESLQASKSDALAPVAVHVDAMRLFAPGKTGPDGPATEAMLAELARVQAYYRSKIS